MACGIKICGIFTNQNLVKSIGSMLLNTGVLYYNAENLVVAFEYLKTTRVDILFIDLDFSDNASFSFLDELKKDKNIAPLYIIGTSFNTNEKFIKLLQKYNIISFIVKPFTPESVMDKIEKVFLKFKDHIPERKFIRIKPEQDELIRLSFQLKNKKLITAKMLDISLGGLAGEMYTEYESDEMKNGVLIEHIVFKIGNREVDVDGLITNKKDKLIAFKFTHFYGNSYENLTRYIMKRLTV